MTRGLVGQNTHLPCSQPSQPATHARGQTQRRHLRVTEKLADMNEWVKKIRSSVHSVVEGKRRKSTAPSAGGGKTEAMPEPEPEPAPVMDQLPPVQQPQLTSITKQRARGPPRRRPTPHSQLQARHTVWCAPTADDDDPARFAWGCDPSIDPALFFSDVIGRSMTRRTNGTARANGSLGSIDEHAAGGGQGEVEGGESEVRGGNVEGREGDVQGGNSHGDSDQNVGSPVMVEDDAETSEGRTSESSDGARGDRGEAPTAEADRSECADNAPESAAVTSSAPPVAGPRGDPSVLRLTGGQVDGAPQRRLCTIV